MNDIDLIQILENSLPVEAATQTDELTHPFRQRGWQLWLIFTVTNFFLAWGTITSL